ncbi:MAG: toxin-antitoxin system TumE family protein [Candidatus Helarchaeota archaeon]
MQKALKLLKSSNAVKKYDIIDYKQGLDFSYFKINVELIDNSLLFIKTYISKIDYLYSYHWQDQQNNLIIRWDNAPHHKKLSTFPHHKHTPDLKESMEIELEDILKVIENEIII